MAQRHDVYVSTFGAPQIRMRGYGHAPNLDSAYTLFYNSYQFSRIKVIWHEVDDQDTLRYPSHG